MKIISGNSIDNDDNDEMIMTLQHNSYRRFTIIRRLENDRI